MGTVEHKIRSAVAECPSCFGSGLADLRCEGVTPETAAQCSECDGTGTVRRGTNWGGTEEGLMSIEDAA
jgi:DnaJ-class molecular chaperone